MMWSLQHVDFQRPSFFHRSHKLQPFEDLVATGISGQQYFLSLEFRKDNDARQIRDGLVNVSSQRILSGLALFCQTFEPLLMLLMKLLQLREHWSNDCESKSISHVDRILSLGEH